MPFPNVLAKMKLDEISVVDRNRLARSLSNDEEQDGSLAKAKPQEQAKDIAALKSDPVLSKYAKMSAMGVPYPSVLSKMKLDDISMNDRNRLARSLDQQLEGAPDTKETASTNANGRRPSVPFQKVHWNTLPEEKIKKSLWSTKSSEAEIIKDEDLEELEALFCSLPQASTAKSSHAVTKKPAVNQNMKLFALEVFYYYYYYY